jgi:FKBP-type peptidyl-prolyl cis-trans isomerase SlpA
MTQAQQGSTVKVHYEGKLEDGTLFDSSRKRGEPIEFKIGEGQLIPGFEKAVEGMETGEKKTVQIPSDQAYGKRREELVQQIPLSDFPENIDPKEGQRLKIGEKGKQELIVEITDVNDENVTVDGNHPLAEKDLTFDLELVEVE